MKYGLVLSAAVLVTVSGCDPAATTTLLVRPEPNLSPRYSVLDQIEAVGCLLVDRGFSKERYAATSQTDDNGLRQIEAECGHLTYWMRRVAEGTDKFVTYARVCVDGAGISVALSDFPRFTQSRSTNDLRTDLLATIPDTIPSVTVEVQ